MEWPKTSKKKKKKKKNPTIADKSFANTNYSLLNTHVQNWFHLSFIFTYWSLRFYLGFLRIQHISLATFFPQFFLVVDILNPIRPYLAWLRKGTLFRCFFCLLVCLFLVGWFLFCFVLFLRMMYRSQWGWPGHLVQQGHFIFWQFSVYNDSALNVVTSTNHLRKAP